MREKIFVFERFCITLRLHKTHTDIADIESVNKCELVFLFAEGVCKKTILNRPY